MLSQGLIDQRAIVSAESRHLLFWLMFRKDNKKAACDQQKYNNTNMYIVKQRQKKIS